MASSDQTNLIITLLNQVKDELKSDIADVRAEIDEIKHRKRGFDWKHLTIGAALIASLSFNFGSESNKTIMQKTIDSISIAHTARAAASSTYTDVAKVYKLTNGNAAGN